MDLQGAEEDPSLALSLLPIDTVSASEEDDFTSLDLYQGRGAGVGHDKRGNERIVRGLRKTGPQCTRAAPLPDPGCSMFQFRPAPLLPASPPPSLLCLIPRLLCRGARLTRHLSCEVTHVIVNASCQSRFALIQVLPIILTWIPYIYLNELLQRRLRDLRFLSSYRHEKRVVGEEWVNLCIAENRLVSPSQGPAILLT